jgi:hypothetical protein
MPENAASVVSAMLSPSGIAPASAVSVAEN